MEVNNSKFYQNLKFDIFRQLSMLSLVLTSSVLILIVFVLCIMGDYQLNKHINTSVYKMHTMDYRHKKLFEGLEKIKLKKNNTEKNKKVVGEFYFVSGRLKKDQLLIFDKYNKLIFSTDDELSKDNLLKEYVGILAATPKNKYLYRLFYSDKGKTYLITYKNDNDNKILMASSSDDIKNMLEQSDLKMALADRFDNVIMKNSNKLVEAKSIKIKRNIFNRPLKFINGDLVMVKRFEILPEIYLYVYESVFSIKIMLWVLLGISLLTVISLRHQSNVIANRVALRNSESINRLVAETSLVSAGVKEEIKMETGDEFEYLSTEINKMVKSITKLYKSWVNIKEESDVFERKMLEAQFNPHFLYNTLEIIRVTASFDVELTEKLILSLTKVLRYSLSGEKDTALECDLSILEHFLSINKIRFEGLSYEISVESELKKMKVPKLFLMPLVENAIKYGSRYREDLTINIFCYQKDNEVIFEVKDNGGGMNKSHISDIMKNLKSDENTQHGLINTYKRLQFYFKSVDLFIKSENNVVSISFKVK